MTRTYFIGSQRPKGNIELLKEVDRPLRNQLITHIAIGIGNEAYSLPNESLCEGFPEVIGK